VWKTLETSAFAVVCRGLRINEESIASRQFVSSWDDLCYVN
jgi:hypothetical protein